MTTSDSWQRRHDVDWLRILALVLLIIYHSVVIFQPWARSINFIISLLLYDLIIKRVNWIHPLFGLKWSHREVKVERS